MKEEINEDRNQMIQRGRFELSRGQRGCDRMERYGSVSIKEETFSFQKKMKHQERQEVLIAKETYYHKVCFL